MQVARKLSDFNERHNIWLKALAVIISILIWLVVVNVSDPVTTTTFSGVPVEITNTEVLTAEGKTYEMLSAGTVTVTVNAKRTILDSISKDYLKAVADMRDLDEETGTIKLKVESNKYSEKIDSMKAKEETITVSVDNLLKRQLPIYASVTGTPADGYVIGDVTMDQNIVRISGPEKAVSEVSKVMAEVSVDGMSSNVSTTVDLRLYNEQGEQINGNGITKNISSIAVVAEILGTKEVGVKAYTSGDPAEGYGMTGEIRITPSTVVIAAKNSVLKNITDLIIPAAELSIEDVTSNVKETFDLSDYLPDSIRFADPEQDTEVKVWVGIDKKETLEKTITYSMISIQNMPEGYRGDFTLDAPIDIILTGMADAMDKLSKEPMTVKIDVADHMKNKGIAELADETTYEVPLTIKLPAGVEIMNERTYTVRLRVTKK